MLAVTLAIVASVITIAPQGGTVIADKSVAHKWAAGEPGSDQIYVNGDEIKIAMVREESRCTHRSSKAVVPCRLESRS